MREPVRLGLMPPLTGLVEMYGAEITCAGQIACDEVNDSGGVLGRPLELVIEDDGSLPESAVEAAAKLVDHHRCVAIIGNLLSNSRIAVAYQVAEPRRIPYLNFSFYEGSILSHYFFHFAALPNQQIDRMIPYMRKRYGPRMFFAGSNYEWPRGSIDAAKRALEQSGGQAVGEEYYPIGVADSDVERLLDHVTESGADVFVPYFAGADQIHLLTRFSERGLKNRIAVVMGHYDEAMSSRLPPDVREGFYSSNTYFMTLDTPENERYLARLATQPGVNGIWPQGDGILTNFGEGAYLCVKAFAKAANQVGSLDAEALIQALETIAVSGPQGAVQMDPATHHAHVNTCLSRCEAEGSFTIIERFGSIAPVLPERYRHLQISKQAGLEDIYLQSRMMAQITEAILLVHATDDAIVYFNPGAERMFGYGSGELAGKRFSELFATSGKSPEKFTATIGKTLSRKGIWQGETENITGDGRHFWCTASISAFTHPRHGEVWMVMNKDITERRQAEEKNRYLASIVESSEDAIIGKTLDGVITSWNKGAEKMYGYAADEAIGRAMSIVIPHGRKGELSRILETISAGKCVEHFETVRRKKNGEKIYVSLSIFPIGDADGNVAGAASVARDITERKRAEESIRVSQAKFSTIFNQAPLGIALIDSFTGRIYEVNPRFAEIAGRTVKEMMHIDWMSITHPDDVQEDLDNMALLNAKKISGFNMDKRYIRPDGSTVWINMTIAPFNMEKDVSPRHLCMIDDVTERKHNEEEIRGLNTNLERRVAERTADLESFAYSVSHDLRVPLRAIDGFSQLVLKRYEGKLDNEGKRLLNVVRNNTKRMGQLIDDILAFSRAGRLEIQAVEIDMGALAREAWQGLEASMAGRNVRLEITLLPKAQGDVAMLRQVWANLLSNAVKFTRPAPAAQIRIEGKTEGTECIYSIKDNGAGFDMQYADKLFGVFQRLHGIEEFEGTGIGLAIVKRIVTRHGGRVWGEGKVNEGAVFYFALPTLTEVRP